MRTAKFAPEGWVQFIRSLARDKKLKVVIGHGVGAATDGETLWLPALPAELTPDDLVLFKGNALHEVGHIRRSSLKFFQGFSKEHGSFAQFQLNALDDVFMEGLEAGWKKMAARYLLDSTLVLIGRNCYRDGSASLGEAVACYSLAYLTAKRWPAVGVATARIEANLRKHLAQHADIVIPALRNLLDSEFPAVKSTEDGGALTLKIIELLKSLSEQEQSQPTPSNESGDGKDDAEGSSESESTPSDTNDADTMPKGEDQADGDEKPEPNGKGKADGESDDSKTDPKGEDGDEGESGDTKPDQNGKSGGNDGDANDAQPNPNGAGQSKGNAENAGSDSSGESGEAGKDESDKEGEGESQNTPSNSSETGKPLKQMVEDMLNEKLGNQEVFDKGSAIEELAKGIAKGANDNYKDQPLIDGLVIDYSVGAGKAEGFVDGMPIVEVDREMAKVIADVTGRKANVMGNRLRALLSNPEETDEYSSRNGRLCDRNLHRFALNDSRIFAKADERVEETAAVSITADLSGSTGVERDGSTVSEQIRIALSLIEKVLHEVGTPREILGFAPKSGELNCMVKSFQDNHRVALDRIAGMHRLVGGNCTPIGAAVLQAGTRLLSHEAQRKLLFVITDGLPDDVKDAREMTKIVLETGVEVIYLVIGSAQACKWLEQANIKFAQSDKAEGLIPALVSKVAEFLA